VDNAAVHKPIGDEQCSRAIGENDGGVICVGIGGSREVEGIDAVDEA
jgi:hypothetical protein